METIPLTIQIISITGALLFMLTIFRLIIRGKLREEYSIIWILSTVVLIVFSVWRQGLEQVSALLGVFYPPSLIFLGALSAMLVFLVHLSVVISKLQNQIKDMTHEMAYMRQDLERLKAQQPQPTPEQPTAPESVSP
ncbi:DUF2304 domain-containing protein [Spirosoma rhododendri]|uniref:DUF2304 domain-containing protein n=1 Tax=Spirosoma rhododendri TaxID=2728024 RepID=A0A7L5DJQ6_9BACT|nr:DUF2304 domain-containing protein [Spirosoma rhododendri]QJD78679.1 DUF2304 domain-containing protein [Spirosoma rhododendri]